MKKILIHSEENQFLVNLIKAIKKKGVSMNILQIMSETADTAYLENSFPEVKIISRHNTSRGIIPQNNKQVIDKVDLNKYLKVEQMFNRFLDFKDPDMNFFGHERRSIYYDILNFTLWSLEEVRPEIVFFTNIPHQLHDSVLAMVCELNQIPIIILRETNLPGVFYFDDVFLKQTKVLNKFMTKNEKSILKMKEIIQNYYSICKERDKKSIFKIYSKWRDHSIPFGKISNIKNFFLSKTLFYFFNYAFFIKNFLRLIVKNFYYCVKKRSFNFEDFIRLLYMEDFFKNKKNTYQNSYTSEYYFEYFLFKNKLKKFSLYRNYLSNQKRFKKEEKYIYFPLHYQPEATTYPYGDVYIDQILAIKMLSNSLPNNIKILIKEHPDTFNVSKIAYIKGAFNRSLDLYKKLNEIKNVEIIPINTDTFEVIDNSIAVATLTGGSGIEAIIRGKPSMIFGNAWYNECEGVLDCSTKSKCEDSIKKILDGINIDEKNSVNFFTNLSSILFPCSRTGAEPHLKFATSKTHLTADRYSGREQEFQTVAEHLIGSLNKY